MNNRWMSLAAVLFGLALGTSAAAQSVSISGYADPPCNNASAAVGVSAGQYLTLKPDGTWELGEYELSTNTVLATGSWTSGSFNPANYEARATGLLSFDHDSGGGPSCQDPDNYYEQGYDSGWVTLTSYAITDVYANTTKDAYCYWAQDTNQFGGTIEIRQKSNHANADAIAVNLCVVGYAY